jgi:hypothetical protein
MLLDDRHGGCRLRVGGQECRHRGWVRLACRRIDFRR